MNRTVLLNSNTYHGFSLEDALQGMLQAGISNVELTATKGWTEHVFPTMSFGELIQLKEAMKDKNIAPLALSGHTNLMDEDRIGDFILNMALANFFGCKYILSSIGEAHLKDRKEISDEEVAEVVKKLVPHLEKYDVILCLENHGKHSTGRHLAEIVKRVDSDRVKINYDTANAVFYGNVDILEDLSSCIDLIGFVHLKDKDGLQDEWNFPAVGSGKLPLLEAIQLLSEHGNDSPLSIEIEFTQKGPSSKEEVDQAVLDSVSYLQKNGVLTKVEESI
ncbi:sugar phosphate isomerase/epimerase family protein [Proteiniclasticum ruminis]|uniref:Sugar phosphate isomerase/epimerase n=1 Tax=Proteiniclasticum ruminis TaxID=398199 RepID=A0A1G8K6D4_9CLOT|nr:sugar phosphate isomerase/epimerase [Proteiniclasticum ruminis]SDI38998.1 Sugar phosphate isomerase/epimerase [Proteiniclasticum ruminis]